MGRVSMKTQITRKSIGKIDNQMSSGIELELVAIHQLDCYTPFFFPKSMWTRFWAQNAIPHQTSSRMTHLKVCMIIISCWDCTLIFNVLITTHMGGFGKIVERGKNVWAAGRELGNLSLEIKKFWMSKRVHFTPLFVKLAKNYICYKGEYWHRFNE